LRARERSRRKPHQGRLTVVVIQIGPPVHAGNEKAPAISTDSWGRQPRAFLPAGFFGGKNRKL
jgi:hypothetical protein